jgi:hypothetical protein
MINNQLDFVFKQCGKIVSSIIFGEPRVENRCARPTTAIAHSARARIEEKPKGLENNENVVVGGGQPKTLVARRDRGFFFFCFRLHRPSVGGYQARDRTRSNQRVSQHETTSPSERERRRSANIKNIEQNKTYHL